MSAGSCCRSPSMAMMACPGMIKAGREARSLARSCGELTTVTRHRLRHFAQQREGAVVGAVIHQHHLKGFAAGLHDGLQASVQVGDILLFIVERYYD